MPNVNISPNMLLPVPVPTTDPGPDWAGNIYACLYSQVDAHDHSSGKGVQITPAGMNINVALNFQGNSATGLLSSKYNSQVAALSGATYPTSVYVSGGELWYNDLVGNQVQLTAGGVVNATSSGISSGTATASFVAGVLVVNSAALTPANIQVGSVLLGNNVASSKYLTLAPPSAMAANYGLVLPPLPVASSFMQLDTSGNMTASVATSGGITAANIASGTITTTQIASNTIVAGNIALSTITGNRIASNTISESNLTASNIGTSGNFTFNNTSTSPTTVTGSVTSSITVTGRRVISVGLMPSGGGGAAGYVAVLFGSQTNQESEIVYQRSQDGGTTWTTLQISSFGSAGSSVINIFPAAGFNILDTTALAGTATYRLQAVNLVSGNTLSFTNVTLNAIEL